MTGAKEFIETVLPWDAAGDNVWFNIHWKQPTQSGNGHFWAGRAYKDLPTMLRGIDLWKQRAALSDFYICMSSQNHCEVKYTKTKNTYHSAVRFQANVVKLKSFFIDVDVKPDAYKTTEEALNALRDFLEVTTLPIPSCVVMSGSGGFHAHWVVDRALSIEEWQPTAHALAGACKSLGLITDNQCTVDSVRILRIPETLNHKTNPPTDVKLLSLGEVYKFEEIKEILEPFEGFVPAVTHKGNGAMSIFEWEVTKQAALADNALSAGIEDRRPTPSVYTLMDQCPFVKTAMETGGEGFANPLWYMTLNIASFTEEGAAAAHLMSELHDDYTVEETDTRYEQIARDHKARDIGWPSCRSIEIAGAKECASCPLKCQNKSPLNFGNVVQLPAPVQPAGINGASKHVDIWPEKYSRRTDGCIYTQITDENGRTTEQKINAYPITDGWVQDKPWTLHFMTVTQVGKSTHMEVRLEEFGGMGQARKVLGEQGMVLSDKQYKLTQEFMVAWIQKLQTEKGAVVTAIPYGWSEDNNGNIEGFSFGGRVWGKGWDRQSSIADPVMQNVFSCKGDMKVWLSASKFITDQLRPELNVLLASSFAAPLTQFTGQHGLLISAFSTKSGVNKSSAFQVGLSVWGMPKKAKSQLDDTGNQTFKKLGYMKSMPIFWDELQTTKQMDDFANFIFKLMGGRERGRMTSKLRLAETETWSSMMISACNRSLLDILQEKAVTHNASLMRIFEYEIFPPDPNGPGRTLPGEASRILEGLEHNYGWAGLAYAQFLGANIEQIRKDIKRRQDQIEQNLKIREDERFWSAAITAVMQGAEYSNRLRLTNIDLDAMEDYLVDQLGKMRKHVKEATVDLSNAINISSLLAKFMAEKRAFNTLVTNRVLTGAGKPPKDAIKILNDPSKLNAICVQMGKEDRRIRISSSVLDEWLRNHKPNPIPKMAFFRALETTFKYKKNQSFIGGGTAFKNLKEYVIDFDGGDFPELWEE
jgi:hypothetical protein